MNDLCSEIGFFLLALTVTGALEDKTFFQERGIDTTWQMTDAEFVGQVSGNTECARLCAIANNCYAFHLTSDSTCLLVKENKNLKEKPPLQTVQFWIKDGVPSSQCTPLMFPLSFGKARYRLVTERKNCSDAALFCEASGSKLAQVSTDGEHQYLWLFVNSSTTDDVEVVHLGMRKDPSDELPHNEGWKWHGSGESVSGTFLWAAGEPNNGDKKEYCAGFFEKDLKLHDYNVDQEGFFFCECTTL